MKIALLLLAVAVALASAGAAAASRWPSDPRICAAGTRATCVEATARIAARKHLGGPGGLWQGPSFHCNRVSSRTLLRWSCPFNAHTYLVVFTASAGRWWVKVMP